ncbi:DUF4333 domain-containing protein [Mycobacterium sp. pV006]|uniref:DUF4333 domain-containing protein n=1 Tax=Mycobacterium sp. pV006 TaxID=3238983 RepID=UPI00351B85C5
MSGPQGPDPTQPWPGQQPESGADQPSGDAAANQGWQPPSGSEQAQPTGAEQTQWQPPAYTPQQYPQYQQPPAYPQQYPPTEQYGQQPPQEYNPAGYPPPGQYGQPGAYGQPYGQPAPGYGQQPGQFGQQPGQFGQYPGYPAPGGEDGQKRSMAVLGTVAGVLVGVVVIAVLVLGFWKPGFFVTTKLDIGAAQQGVQQILTDETNGYGAKNVSNVSCNGGVSPTVRKGDTFDCEVSIDGTKRQVTVTFQDDNGTYEVGRPR